MSVMPAELNVNLARINFAMVAVHILLPSVSVANSKSGYNL